eukprot:scaffold15.g4244.t1
MPRVLRAPATFQPKPHYTSGRIEHWGVLSDPEWMLYRDGERPEVQFVRALMLKKDAALEAARPAAEPLRDFVLDIDLAARDTPAPHYQLKPRLWRRVRMSGGMPLTSLADKVVAPVMTDHHGGALFGPKDSGAIDAMKSRNDAENGRDGFVPFQILPAEESTGAAAVLDGALACPPEDSSGMADSGSRGIQEFLSAVLDRSSPERRRMLAEASKALNYRDRPYKPTDFSVAAAQHALEQALASRASVQSGAKQFMMPFPMMGGGRMGGGMAGLPLWGDGGPMKQVLTEAQGNGSFLQETVSTAKDAKLIAICGSCGNPYDLMTCSGGAGKALQSGAAPARFRRQWRRELSGLAASLASAAAAEVAQVEAGTCDAAEARVARMKRGH